MLSPPHPVIDQIGVAMGAGGSAMAARAADVVLLTNDLIKLPRTLALCR